MTLMQRALASQQAVAAGISEDLAPDTAGGNGSDTGEMSCASGLPISPSRGGMLDYRIAPEPGVVPAAPLVSSSHTGA
jgi:hypothetical protein